jgi:hypothetical protein
VDLLVLDLRFRNRRENYIEICGPSYLNLENI